MCVIHFNAIECIFEKSPFLISPTSIYIVISLSSLIILSFFILSFFPFFLW